MRNLIWIPIALVLLLEACTTVAADKVLTNAEWVVCNLTSVGAIKRRYGQTIERANTYKDFCDSDGKANVIAPE